MWLTTSEDAHAATHGVRSSARNAVECSEPRTPLRKAPWLTTDEDALVVMLEPVVPVLKDDQHDFVPGRGHYVIPAQLTASRGVSITRGTMEQPRDSDNGDVTVDERGQAMTEYALVVAACVAALLGVLSIFLTATVNYYEDIMYLVGLPFP